MKAAVAKSLKQKFHKILVDHDIPAFREYLKEISKDGKNPHSSLFAAGATDEELSDLAYSMKSRLMYLGEDFQQARNIMRHKQFCEATGLAYREEDVAHIPTCSSCKFFQTAPTKSEQPCMQLGATPGDICCPGYTPAQSAQNRV